MHKNYCNKCHQPVHGYRNLCPEWKPGEGQNGHVPDREPYVDNVWEDKWEWEDET